MVGKPEDRLVEVDGGVGLDAAREAPADLAAVALGDRVRAAGVPLDGQQDAHRLRDALDVAVEGAPEPLLVLGRDERIDEDDRLRRLVVDAADLLLPALRATVIRRPVGMEAGPAPQPRRQFLHPHPRRP